MQRKQKTLFVQKNSPISRGRSGSSWSLWFWAVGLDECSSMPVSTNIYQYLSASPNLSSLYISVHLCPCLYQPFHSFLYVVLIFSVTASQSHYRQQPPSSAFNHLLGEAAEDLALAYIKGSREVMCEKQCRFETPEQGNKFWEFVGTALTTCCSCCPSTCRILACFGYS